jgi:hypothetical protein
VLTQAGAHIRRSATEPVAKPRRTFARAFAQLRWLWLSAAAVLLLGSLAAILFWT